MRVRWLAAARADVREIGRWIARDRPAAATDVMRRIRAAAAGLGRNPSLGHAGDVIDVRELIVPGLPYLIIYRVRDAVEIVWVIDARRDWPASFDLRSRLGDDAGPPARP